MPGRRYNDHRLRQHCQSHYQINNRMGQKVLHALCLFRRHGLQCIHGVGIPVGQKALYKEHDNSKADDNAADGCRESVIAAYLSHELVVNEHRQRLIAFTDKHGRTEVSKHPHENKHGAGQKRRHDQRNDNPANPACFAAAQAFRRLVQ